MKLTMATMVLIAGFTFFAQAEEATTQDHQQHQAAQPTTEKKPEGMMNHKMMDGKMDMGKMHAMMGDCMKMHKDGKMCEGQMMDECQKNTEKGECTKMMKKMKKDK